MRKTVLFVLLALSSASAARADDALQLAALMGVYATSPHAYPTGVDARNVRYAEPDTSVPFRWHFYHDGAVARFDDAMMDTHVAPYNRLEDAGAKVAYRSPVTFAFVGEHVTEGERALRVDFPAAEVKSGKAVVLIEATEGPIFDTYSKMRTAAYWSHYRWFKSDVFNPQDVDVRVRVGAAPIRLHPGANAVAVKTVDAVVNCEAHSGVMRALPIRVVSPEADVTLFIDHCRMEQEVPSVLSRRGKMLQFAAWASKDRGDGIVPVLWPGFTHLDTPKNRGLSFRSYENGVVWGRAVDPEPLRIDVPNGRYGVHVFAVPGSGFQWSAGMTLRINGKDHVILTSRTNEEVRRAALGGETWDYRPGACVWQELVREPFFPETKVVYADATDGALVLEFPRRTSVRWVIVFPEAAKTEALKELGRLNALLAESWDVSHAQVAGPHAEEVRYIGSHEESSHPELIPERLRALALTDTDFARGFLTFHRGLVEAVYPDTIPSPEEARPRELRVVASRGQRTCVTLSLLPLAEVKGLRVRATCPQAEVDVRFSRYHQKCMEYGHHNHAYTYQEHFLVRRPTLDLYPGAAKRVYVEIAVARDAPPGEHAGKITIASAEGATLAELPLRLEVLPVTLVEPPVHFGSESSHARMREYGLNLSSGDYDEAKRNGFAAWAVWPYDATRPHIAGRRLGWSLLIENRDFLNPLIEAGRDGKDMRLLFGGPFPGERYGGKNNDAVRDEWTAKMLAAFPRMDIVGVTMPTYFFEGPGYAHSGSVWERQVRTKGKPELLEAARQSGNPFWFVDWLRHSKEQPARFTFGFWLWKLGAIGKFTTFTYGGDYHYGTAKEAYAWEPYYTLLGVVGGNATPALKESLTPGEVNPSRDLVLTREGINDYRAIYTLDALIRDAEKSKRGGAVLATARKFRDDLASDLSLDLNAYYESRSGAYAENWYPKPGNPWTTARFDAVRRACLDHVMRLQKALGR